MTDFWFFATVAIAISSFALAIIESLGMLFFWPWVFRIGPRVLHEARENSAGAPLPVGDSITSRSAKYLVIEPTVCLFRIKFRLFGFSTPFPVKGTIRVKPTSLVFEGRIPVGTSMFFGLWLSGWTYASLTMLFAPERVSNDTGIPAPLFIMAGYLFAGGLIAFSLWLESRRAQVAIREFISHRSAA